jgi:hypothetical protein
VAVACEVVGREVVVGVACVEALVAALEEACVLNVVSVEAVLPCWLPPKPWLLTTAQQSTAHRASDTIRG